jgi:hypothetical protein
MRREQRSVTEIELRATLGAIDWVRTERCEGWFMISVARNNRLWIVIVAPDTDASLMVVVTAYEVSH